MSEPKRILQMIGSLNMGGSQTMIINLYKKIDRKKIQFDFIIDRPKDLYFAELVKSMGAKIFYLPRFTGFNYFKVKKSWRIFLKEHKEYKVIHSHIRSYAIIFLSIAQKFGLKTIIHSHSISNGKGIVSFFKKIMQFPLRKKANYCFSCSKEAGEWLFGKKITRSNKYFMIPNAIDTSLYNESNECLLKYKEELNLIGEKIFIHVGRLHESKNHLFLLDVFKEIINIYPNSTLLIVGDGPLKKEIDEKIKFLSLSDHVKMLGIRNDISTLLQISDCFLFPSKWEGLPVTVVEAQAAGLQCLISDKITKDVNLSDLVTYLPIDQGINPWVSTIKKMNFKKENVIKNIKQAGFDIETSANFITDFYLRIENE